MKKNYLITLILLLSSFFIQAQCDDVSNGAFEMGACADADDAFTLGCVQGWNASHGTPSVFGTGTTTRAWMWGNYGRGEGIYTDYSFIAGETYEVKFKIKKTSAFTIIPNSRAIFRAVTGLNPSASTTFPSMPSGSEVVYSSLMTTDLNAGEKTVSFNFTATVNNSQLWIYPQNSANGRQVNLEIDDLSITKKVIVTSEFHFQDPNGQVKNSFLCNEDIYLNGNASLGESQYYIDVWRRDVGNSVPFTWKQRLGTDGWTMGQVGVLNLTQIFANQNYEFESGYEYQIKLATANPPCVDWEETKHTFTIPKPIASTGFTFNTFCAADGTISVEVTGVSNVYGGAHWWRIFETSVSGSTSDVNTIGTVTAIKGGMTALFTGLSKNKKYYIKHGVFDGNSSCIGWVEERKAFSGQIPWDNITTNFDFTNIISNGSSISVTVTAHNNLIYVNNHWSISYAPNGNSNITDIPVLNSPSQCCGASVSFNQNLQVNTWYFIKHGITNDCIEWRETRKVFRVYLEKSLSDKPKYLIEVREEGNISLSVEEQQNVLYPNPIEAGKYCELKVNTENLKAILVSNSLGKSSKEVRFKKIDKETIRFIIDENFIEGINFIKVLKNDNTTFDGKLIVK
ncbi:hypothetical protein PG911_11490 [Tenacibaculum ovolyticum]|uniref:hypothetical protein n=1 Tax=Tenacibaculum ovolyticum TaxID=104270 RepID=UPI0022F38966|nr:hypothetical protein [Tenacibaculum ovolyticum]WBX75281.1 hypothetical protein PG911_11490 [Tenacibaculum ovolyticum]